MEFNSLLLVDDDTTFCKVLSRALEKRGFARALNMHRRTLQRKLGKPPYSKPQRV
jgi:ActR/RegA family two-component response regulator